MKPQISGTGFGWIEINGERFEHDVLIRPTGDIKKRKKKLSKQVFGTSHKLSINEARYILKIKSEALIIGTGQTGLLELSKEAADYFKKRNCCVTLAPTPHATQLFNSSGPETTGLFHVTC